MEKKIQFCGSTTIGPKGQVVIPSKLRKELKIETGDQFVVMKNDHMDSIVLIKADNLTSMLKDISKEISSIEKKLNKKK